MVVLKRAECMQQIHRCFVSTCGLVLQGSLTFMAWKLVPLVLGWALIQSLATLMALGSAEKFFAAMAASSPAITCATLSVNHTLD